MPRDLLADMPAQRQPRDLLAPQDDAGSTFTDILKSGASGLARGAQELVGLPGTIGDALQSGLSWATGLPALPPSPLSGAAIRKVGSELTGGATEYEPKTRAGRYASTIGEFVPGAAAFGGGSVGNLIKYAALPGAASEGAGQATEGSALEPYARLAGAIGGASLPAIGRRLVTPFPISAERAAQVNTLKAEGVKDLTAGQITGRKGLQYLESELGGGAAANMLERQGEQFTAAALSKAGIKANRATPEVINDAFERIGGQFDDLAAKTTVPFDQKLQNQMLNAATDYQAVSAKAAPAVEEVMNRAAELATKNGGVLSGEAYKNLTTRIRELSARSDGATQTALGDLRNALDDAVERNMPADFLDQWREARNQYRNMLVLERAATGPGAETAMGIISPSQLRSATVGQSRRSYARGKGDFAKLSRAGEALLRPLPNSGTAPRLRASNAGASALSIMGALGGNSVGGAPGMVAGLVLGSAAPSAIGRGILWSPVRSYLTNQAAASAPGLDARTLAIMSALYGRSSSLPPPERRR